jgi:hypothetical protein
MQTWTPAPRGTPFQIGARYRPLKAVATFPPEQSLIAGEVVIYQQSGYSRYDGCSIYAFVNELGEERSWWLSDDASDDSWREVFAQVKDIE